MEGATEREREREKHCTPAVAVNVGTSLTFVFPTYSEYSHGSIEYWKIEEWLYMYIYIYIYHIHTLSCFRFQPKCSLSVLIVWSLVTFKYMRVVSRLELRAL